ncbi:MAG: hypothetical protein ACU0BF_04020 [Paracoccaceae bacterium]
MTRSLPLLALGATLMLAAVAAMLPAPTAAPLVAEGGPVEWASVILYALGAGLILARRLPWPFAVVLLALGARELDLDKRGFTEGLLKARQYTGDAVPLGERLLAAAILGLLIWVGLRILRRHGRAFAAGLRTRAAWAWAVAGAVILAVVSKTLDGLGRKLAPLGFEVGPRADAAALALEEVLELGIPLMLIAAILAWGAR